MSERDSSGDMSTSPRVSSIFDSKPHKPGASVALPDENLPHLAKEIAGRTAAPSAVEHYSDDPVHTGASMPNVPAPPVPLARLDEEDDVETGDFAVEDDYLIPDANDGTLIASGCGLWSVDNGGSNLARARRSGISVCVRCGFQPSLKTRGAQNLKSAS